MRLAGEKKAPRLRVDSMTAPQEWMCCPARQGRFRVSFATAIAGKTRGAARRWRVLATACLAHVLHDGYTDMLYLLFPFWQRELSLSFAQVGLLKTLYSGSMAMAQVPAGRLGERCGERLLLVAGTVLTAGAVLAFHYASTPVILGLLLVLGGVGASVQHPLSSSLVTKSYGGPTLRTVLGTYNFAGDLGKVAIPGALAVLIAQFGWQAGTQAVGVLGLAVAATLFVALAAPAGGHTSESPGASARRAHLPERTRRQAFAALSAIGVLDSATRTGLLTFLPFVLARKGASAGEIGAALSLVFAGGAAGKFACGALATRLGVLRTVVLTEAGTAVGIVLVLTLPVWHCLALMPAVGVALNGTSSVLYGSVPELAAEGREARAFGLFYTMTIGAGAIAPPLFGIVGDVLNLTGAVLLVAAVVLMILPLVFLLRPVFRT
jgi:FSR family fosmidomycin resistance protein-like MFS transporter